LKGDLKKNCIVIVDKNLVKTKDRGVVRIPFTAIADRLGKKIVANVIMLGALTAMTEVVSKDSMLKAVKANVPKKALDINIEAFEEGFKMGGC
jgi:2-oxoglutarate ferredoxin oxidoreductase subunit gamma